MSSRLNSSERYSFTRRALLAGMLVGAALAGAGCGGNKELTPAQRAEVIRKDRDAYGVLGYRHEWSGFPTMTAGARVKFFDIFGDILTVQDSAGLISVLEAGSGQTRWSDQLGTPLTKFVGNVRDAETGRIIVSSESEAFSMDTDTGTLLGKQHLDRVVNTRPILEGDMLVYGTASGEIFGQVKGQGFKAWGNSVSGAIETDGVHFKTGVVGYVSQLGDIRFVDGRTGESVGKGRIYGGASVDPAASDRAMFIASNDQSIYAFAPTGGAVLWRKRTDTRLRYQPIYHADRLYCAADGTGMMCLDAASGSEVWVSPDVLGYVVGMRNGRLVAWDGHEAMTLDPASGSVIDRVRLNDVAALKMDKFEDGNMYSVTKRGVVAKFVPR